ncbi:MAG: hypothetical protein QG559_1613 [Campylobacterota bacterium]|nr:hypothetical protein [Campylobacterota bacterium]
MKKVLLASLLVATAIFAKEASLAEHEAKMQQMKERAGSMGEEASALKEQNREREQNKEQNQEQNQENNKEKTKEKKENKNRYGSESSQGSQNMYEGSRKGGGGGGGGRR